MSGLPGTSPPWPTARSAWECQAFLTLTPCPGCAGPGLRPREIATLTGDAGKRWEYHAICARCGRSETFTFALAAEPAPAYPEFGGATPSQLLDAGQFLVLAEVVADTVAADPYEIDLPGPDAVGTIAQELARARDDIGVAVAAAAECLKFVPAGATAVPRSALWSPAGLARFDADPEAFERRHLLSTLGAFREVQWEYSRVGGEA
ncbi:hypothetical protein GCM10027280_24620 [Micromonospora polyrhachis]|uniref:Uncharacterized protein n=1 Tax=Micromonospora polyrhachis TaxID=1282883 RepID=A0A7W7ST42_9ACTN|nr:hypothetical protein [Micromonospora polyrhachis]MBB4960444.1 hypothetical protein [Micromonospora polyrhachis]